VESVHTSNTFRQRRTFSNQLLEQASEYICGFLFLLSSVVAIHVSDTDTRVILKSCAEVVDSDGCYHGLARSWNAWAEQSLLAFVEPPLEFIRIQEP
jgi:hypothetical protein